jgi:hypothetical protein
MAMQTKKSTTVPLNWKEVWFTNCPMVSANNVDQELGWCALWVNLPKKGGSSFMGSEITNPAHGGMIESYLFIERHNKFHLRIEYA